VSRGPGVALVAWLVLATVAAAAPRMETTPAFDCWRDGDLVAFRVELENDGPAGLFRVRGRSTGAKGRPRTEQLLELAAGARKSIWIALQPSSPQVEFVLERDGALLARTTHDLSTESWSVPLLATLAPPPAAFVRELEGSSRIRPRARIVESSPALLPDDPLLWPSIDQLLWPAPRAHELSARQAAALRSWVGHGGRLVAGTHREDPTALVTLGLLPADVTEGVQALGWGRVERVAGDLSLAGADDWLAPLALEPEPPAARKHGPESLVWRVQRQVDEAIAPPVAAATLVLSTALAGLLLVPWLGARRKAKARVRSRRRLPLGFTVMTAATLASFAVAHFGAGRGLVLHRLDVVDVDADAGRTRAHSVFAVRRARAGSLSLETGGAGRLRVLDHPGTRRLDASLGANQVFEGKVSASTAGVGSWETLRLAARWQEDAIALPDLHQAPEALGRALGAEQFAIKDASGLEWLAEDSPSGLDAAAAWLLPGRRDGYGRTAPEDLKELAQSVLFNMDPREQWRWPGNERWRARPGERVLLALARGAAAPTLVVDGRERTGESWTLWRVRLPAQGGSPR
jgi:hypothetical protein